MKRAWRRIAERVDNATLRERVLIFGALAVLVVALMDALFIDTELAKQKRLAREIAQRQTETTALQDQIRKLALAHQTGPDLQNRERLERLRRDIAALEASIAEAQRKLTAPEQMRSVLEEMLSRNRRVALVDMKTLPPAAIADMRAQGGAAPASKAAAKAAAAPAERQVFRHGVEITVAGAYLDLMAYVAALEKLPTQLYWGGAEMDASAYPVVKLKVTVFTLSLDKAWMSV